MPKFCSFENYIEMELKSQGWDVYFIEDDYFSNNWSIFFKLFPFLKLTFSGFYFSFHFWRYSNLYFDKVLVIKGGELSKKSIIKMSKQIISKENTTVLYLWDSIRNVPNSLNISELFNEVFTFDYEDAKLFGFKFRPIFFPNNSLTYKSIRPNNKTIYFLGSYHSDRLHSLQKLKQFIPTEYNIDFTIFGGRLAYFSNFFSKNDKKDSRVKRIFKRISYQHAINKMSKAQVIVDINHEGQSGLTQRAIECIFIEKKLITDNKDIVNYDFYDKNNIYIIQNNSFKGLSDFLKKPYKKLDSKILTRYKLSSWLKEILSYDK